MLRRRPWPHRLRCRGALWYYPFKHPALSCRRAVPVRAAGSGPRAVVAVSPETTALNVTAGAPPPPPASPR
ncbi:hypothetical protein GCM10009546_46030 [Actinomadura livida]|uniref:Uncharacterized protein n=1 Tax=Actinomadura livida TaxID=79909 RepID=A0ABP3Q475_9ACTN|nr:hypothetical protein GCM10010208_12860 [Actinomadura livida]